MDVCMNLIYSAVALEELLGYVCVCMYVCMDVCMNLIYSAAALEELLGYVCVCVMYVWMYV
jgi:hypothetical protein